MLLIESFSKTQSEVKYGQDSCTQTVIDLYRLDV